MFTGNRTEWACLLAIEPKHYAADDQQRQTHRHNGANGLAQEGTTECERHHDKRSHQYERRDGRILQALARRRFAVSISWHVVEPFQTSG